MIIQGIFLVWIKNLRDHAVKRCARCKVWSVWAGGAIGVEAMLNDVVIDNSQRVAYMDHNHGVPRVP